MTDATVAQIKPVPTARQPAADYREIVWRAIEQGSSMEVLEKLLALQERWEVNQARRSFEEAITAAKAHMPVIVKNRTVSYGGAGKTSYRHEDLAEIARTIDPVLGEHGLSYRFRTNQVDNRVSVTCVVSHRDGHSEENTLSAGYDTSGSKNPIQALGSAVTYLQRYALKAALGLAVSDEDDGQAAGSATKPLVPPPSGTYVKLLAEIAKVKTRKELGEWGAKNSEQIALLPEDRQANLRRLYKEIATTIEKKEPPAPIPSHDADGIILDDVALVESGITHPGNVVWDDEQPLPESDPIRVHNGPTNVKLPIRNEVLWLQLFESNIIACKNAKEISALTNEIPGDLSDATLEKARQLTVKHLGRVAGGRK